MQKLQITRSSPTYNELVEFYKKEKRAKLKVRLKYIILIKKKGCNIRNEAEGKDDNCYSIKNVRFLIVIKFYCDINKKFKFNMDFIYSPKISGGQYTPAVGSSTINRPGALMPLSEVALQDL